MKECVNVFLILVIIGFLNGAIAQSSISGTVGSAEGGVPGASVLIKNSKTGTATDLTGSFAITNIESTRITLQVSAIGYRTFTKTYNLQKGLNKLDVIRLEVDVMALDEIVVTSGTLKEVSKLESPVPVEVYRPTFFKKNPTPSIYDGLSNINGVRPQLNCNVCNTGDIHINGLEGPYTMVLLDGMPIVSGLSTVYGLSGIPSSLVEQIEIVKGPASSLYGSEAVAGLINIITKNPSKAPLFSADVFTTGWGEVNADLGVKLKAGEKASSLLGVNYFNYQQVIDQNNDNFTDLTLQHRISVFNKWQFSRPEQRQFSVAARYYYEDRWGGDVRWTPEFRGGDQIYGESIFTDRKEITGSYQLPVKERVFFNTSFNSHNQNSVYGDVIFKAEQNIGFAQMVWDKVLGNHSLLTGATYRYTFYDDNTSATEKADKIHLPGLFVQDEWRLSDKFKFLSGLRFDYDRRHGNIWSPRAALKWTPDTKNIFRLNVGSGFRVVNIFTEDHAALTGAREVIINGELKPERSINSNLNYVRQIPMKYGFINLDASVWYTYFSNKILPDYETDPNSITYDNLDGHAVSQGISLNVDATFTFPLKIMAGVSVMDVSSFEDIEGSTIKERQLLTERFTGTWLVSYEFSQLGLSLDYTGNLYGPMRLPLLGELDSRDGESPWWSIQNIQLTKKVASKIEMYGGVKNLLDFTPADNSIARTNDPFDREVEFDTDGNVVPTPVNPFALTFDPTYVYAPYQGRRLFFGVRYTLVD